MGQRAIDTRTARYTERDDGIIQQVVLPNTRQELADAQENVRAFAVLSGGRRRLLLVDMRANFHTGPGVRQYYAGPDAARYCSAMAMLVGVASSRIVGNFFLALTSPSFPCRLFTEESAALGWLRAHASGDLVV